MDYEQKFNSMIIFDTSKVLPIVEKIKSGRTIYELVSKDTGVPWYVIGIVHYKECSCNFNLHLHNGDPLTARTVRVPAGRPKTGNPPFPWAYSARDALADRPNKDWSINGTLYWLEAYNGFGYTNLKVTNPYLWAGSQYYTKGLYVRDGVYDPNVVWTGVGCALIMKYLLEKPIIVPQKSKWEIWTEKIKAALAVLKKR